jgi:hypothetical protein
MFAFLIYDSRGGELRLSQNKGFELCLTLTTDFTNKAWKVEYGICKKISSDFYGEDRRTRTEGKEWTLSVDFSNLTAQSQEARGDVVATDLLCEKQKVNVR